MAIGEEQEKDVDSRKTDKDDASDFIDSVLQYCPLEPQDFDEYNEFLRHSLLSKPTERYK